jgi:hypothetical protein
VETALTLVGFGKSTAMPTTTDQLSGFLRKGENDTIACTEVPFHATRPEILDERSLCFDTEAEPGACERDSVSGARDTNIGACGKYGIYTAVFHELTYIESVTGPLDGTVTTPPKAAADGGAAAPPATVAPGGGTTPPSSSSAGPDAESDASTPGASNGCTISTSGTRPPLGNAGLLGLVLGCVAVLRSRGRASRAK